MQASIIYNLKKDFLPALRLLAGKPSSKDMFNPTQMCAVRPDLAFRDIFGLLVAGTCAEPAKDESSEEYSSQNGQEVAYI
jgi:hypothetical protein